MPPNSPHPTERSPLHALCVYAESLADARRVVLFGDSTSGVAETLAQMGARMVSVCDPDVARVRSREKAGAAARGVTVRELRLREFDVRDGAFDLAIIPDLSVLPDVAGALAEARRLVGVEGALLVAVQNPDALPEGAASSIAIDYYSLYDLVALQFQSVRMIGIVPFQGVALAELGEREGSPEVSVDTQLAEAEETPTHFAALASQSDVALGAFSIVKLPKPTVPFEAAISDKDDRLQVAVLRAREADAELALLRERVRRTEDELERSSQKHVRTSTALAGTEAEVERLRATPKDLPLGATADAMAALGRAESRVRELEAALRTADENAIALDSRVSELEASLAKREADWTHELTHVHADRDDYDRAHDEEIKMLEDRLEERGEAVRSLEEDVLRHARVAKDLVATLEDLRKTLDRQAEDAARRESELVAREWTVGELDARAARENSRGDARPSKDAGSSVDAGSLTRAQAAFAEQSALVEQLRAELGRRTVEDGSSS